MISSKFCFSQKQSKSDSLMEAVSYHLYTFQWDSSILASNELIHLDSNSGIGFLSRATAYFRLKNTYKANGENDKYLAAVKSAKTDYEKAIKFMPLQMEERNDALYLCKQNIDSCQIILKLFSN
jgi:hypothetical protein